MFLAPPEGWIGPAPGERGLTVGAAACTVDRYGHVSEARTAPVQASADVAGDLAWQPQAFVSAVCGDYRGTTQWLVSVLGFIEEEAELAAEAVAAALLAVISAPVTRAQ